MGKVQDSFKKLRDLVVNIYLQNGNEECIYWLEDISPYIPDDDKPNFDHPEEKEWDISTDEYVNLEVKDGLITVFYDERGDPEEPIKEPADYNQLLFWNIDKAEETARRILTAVVTYRSKNEASTA